MKIHALAVVIIASLVCGHEFMLAPTVHAAEDDAKSSSLLKDAQKQFSSITKAAVEAQKIDPAKVALGRQLFFDPRLSADGVWSCMLCHQPTLYGTDAQALTRGVFDKPLGRNAPTVLNSSLQFKAHWDGVFASVEDQAEHALLGPGFGNKDNAEAMARINGISGYAEPFRQAFPNEANPVTPQNFGIAVGAYEKTLLTPSRFDEFLDGKVSALSPIEQSGLRLFLDVGCVNCHNKSGVGGNTFEKFGEASDYWPETKSKSIDKGRFNLTKEAEDLYVFKVSSLRNVEMTPPYFHDGSLTSLSEAVRIMAKVQLGTDMPQSEIDAIVAFLKSLTGPLPDNFVKVPVLPPAPFR